MAASDLEVQEIVNHIKSKLKDGSWTVAELKEKARKYDIAGVGDVLVRDYAVSLYKSGFRRQFIPSEKTYRLRIIQPTSGGRSTSSVHRSPSPTRGGGRLSPTRGSGSPTRNRSPTRGSGYHSPTRGSGYDKTTKAGHYGEQRYGSPTKAGHYGEQRYGSPTKAGNYPRQTSPTRGAGGRYTSGGAPDSAYALRPGSPVHRRVY